MTRGRRTAAQNGNLYVDGVIYDGAMVANRSAALTSACTDGADRITGRGGNDTLTDEGGADKFTLHSQ